MSPRRLLPLCLLALAPLAFAEETNSNLTLDSLFPTDRVIDVQITVDEKDWDTIRHQTRNLFDVLGEERKQGPIEGPYTYVDASVTIDGHEFPKVGIRKKGFIGSQSDSRPSLKVKLNHVVKGQGIDGLTNLTFNNNKQDSTLVNQFMGYALFNEAGAPSTRCAFAQITLNGVNLGVYSHVESMRKPLMERIFGSDEGTLYEGTVVDFRDGWENSFEHKFGDDTTARERITKLIALLESDEVNKDPEKLIGEFVDLDSFYAYWATEGLLGFWDGYSGNANNFFVYLNPKTNRFHFMPWGADALFDKYSELGHDPKAPISVKTKGMVAHKLYLSESGRKRYRETLQGLLKEQWDEKALLAETKRLEKLLKPHLAPIQSNHPEKLKELRKFIRSRRADLVEEIKDGMPKWTKVPEPPPIISNDIAKSLNADSLWNAAKKGDTEGIKKHLADGVDVNERNQFGSTAISLASLAGETEAVKLLLAKGANPSPRNRENNTPLHSAAFVGELETVKILLAANAEINARNESGETPLDVCTTPWSEEIEGFVQWIGGMLQMKFDLEEVKSGRPKVATLLRKHNAKSSDDLPKDNNTEIWDAAKDGDLETLETLLADDNTDPNKQDKDGITALSWASMTGELKAVELLLANGADVNATNRDGATALHSAAFLGQPGIVKLLLENNADKTKKSDRGDTPFDTVKDPWSPQIEGILKFIAGALKIEVDIEQVKAARPKIAQLLKNPADQID